MIESTGDDLDDEEVVLVTMGGGVESAVEVEDVDSKVGAAGKGPDAVVVVVIDG